MTPCIVKAKHGTGKVLTALGGTCYWFSVHETSKILVIIKGCRPQPFPQEGSVFFG